VQALVEVALLLLGVRRAGITDSEEGPLLEVGLALPLLPQVREDLGGFLVAVQDEQRGEDSPLPLGPPESAT
jgi:hypothetical protein